MDFKEDIKVLIIMFLVILFLILFFVSVLIFVDHFLDKNVFCPNFGQEIGMPTKYNFFAGGCFVQTKEGNWIPTSKYIVVTK
jgi:hypothetical protein